MKDQRFITDEQVEAEISQLRESDYVQLAKKEEQIKYRRRQYLYKLRNLEKRGRELSAQGYTLDTLEDEM